MKSINVIFPEKEKVEIKEEEVPELEPTEIRCQARKSLVSTGTETLCLQGVFDSQTNWASWVKYPFYPGYSMAAEVIARGSDVQGISIGDRVSASMAHKQIFNIDYRGVHPIPEGISDEQAAWVALAKITQVGTRRAELKLGETVGIIGLGLLGQLVTQYLRNSGAGMIVAIDPVADRLSMAQENGATHLLEMDAGAASDEVKKLTGGKMLDVVFDITGHPAVLSMATLLVGNMGKVVLLGDTTTPSQQHLGPNVVYNSVSILGIHANMANHYKGWDASGMTDLFYTFLQQGRMKIDHMISHRYSPLEAPQVYEGLLQDRQAAMGIIFDWDKISK